MAKNTQLATSLANAQADLLARLLDNGYLRLYTGAQPADADTALSGQTLVAQLRFAAVSAPAATNGALSFTPPVSVYSMAGGTVTWFRALADDGSTVVFDGSVGLAGDTPNLIVDDVTVTAGQLVVIGSLTHSVLRSSTGL